MIQGTTPTITLTIQSESVDLTQAQNVYVSIVQGAIEIEKTGDDLEITERSVSVWLTQEETLKLSVGATAEVQVNWTFLDGNRVCRAATKTKRFTVGRQLLKRVVE